MKSNNPSFAIGIPTINQWPLLQTFLPMYAADFPGTTVYIVDNGAQGIPADLAGTVVYQEEKNIGVAAAWNKLCQRIFYQGHTHAIIANDDVYWGYNEERMHYLLTTYPRDFYKTSHDNWCFFVITREMYEKTGPFNEKYWPAYFEDRDYFRRMKLAGRSIFESVWFDPRILYESQSIKKDNSLLDNFDKNEGLYIEEWGGKPGWEKWDKPYNGKEPIHWAGF